jgi:hypothetical protein
MIEQFHAGHYVATKILALSALGSLARADMTEHSWEVRLTSRSVPATLRSFPRICHFGVLVSIIRSHITWFARPLDDALRHAAELIMNGEVSRPAFQIHSQVVTYSSINYNAPLFCVCLRLRFACRDRDRPSVAQSLRQVVWYPMGLLAIH